MGNLSVERQPVYKYVNNFDDKKNHGNNYFDVQDTMTNCLLTLLNTALYISKN